MPRIFTRFWHMMNSDLLGQAQQREMVHPVFGLIHYFGRHDQADNYWEAEYTPVGFSRPITVIIPSTGEPPTAADLALTHALLEDVGELSARCKRAIAKHVDPTRIGDLRLDGLELPRHGAVAGSWSVTHWASSEQRWFTVTFVGEEARGVDIDS